MRIKIVLQSKFIGYVDIINNIKGFKNKKSYYIFFSIVKKLLFIFDCSTKYSLQKSVNFFANLLIIMLTGIVTGASFYICIRIIYVCIYRISIIMLQFLFNSKLNLLCML